MRIDPRLRQAAETGQVQREAQQALLAACDAWRADPRIAPLLCGLERFGEGADLREVPELGGAIGDAGRETALSLLDHVLPALAAFPLGQLPLRHNSDHQVSTLLLARAGRALLILAAREPGHYPRECASFSDGERHEIILAGSASGRLARAPVSSGTGAGLACEMRALAPGTSLSLSQRREALLVDHVHSRLVSLRLVREAQDPRPTREYRLCDGTLMHQAAGALEQSRQELILALLGRMGRHDAAPVLAEMALEKEQRGNRHLRWQALREAIALDTEAGFRALCAIAADPGDPLAVPARKLRARLLLAHPVLARLEAA